MADESRDLEDDDLLQAAVDNIADLETVVGLDEDGRRYLAHLDEVEDPDTDGLDCDTDEHDDEEEVD